MDKKLLSIFVFSLVLLSGISTISALSGDSKYISLRAEGGNVINLAHFRDFSYEKTSLSLWARVGDFVNYEAQTMKGTAGLSVLGVTSGGNRVTVTFKGNLMYYEETPQFTTYVYEGGAYFKTGKLLPQDYQMYLFVRENKETGETYISSFGPVFDRLVMVRHLDVTKLK